MSGLFLCRFVALCGLLLGAVAVVLPAVETAPTAASGPTLVTVVVSALPGTEPPRAVVLDGDGGEPRLGTEIALTGVAEAAWLQHRLPARRLQVQPDGEAWRVVEDLGAVIAADLDAVEPLTAGDPGDWAERLLVEPVPMRVVAVHAGRALLRHDGALSAARSLRTASDADLPVVADDGTFVLVDGVGDAGLAWTAGATVALRPRGVP